MQMMRILLDHLCCGGPNEQEEKDKLENYEVVPYGSDRYEEVQLIRLILLPRQGTQHLAFLYLRQSNGRGVTG